MSVKCITFSCCLNIENEFIGMFFLCAFAYVNTGFSDVDNSICSLLTWNWLFPKLNQWVLIKSAVFEWTFKLLTWCIRTQWNATNEGNNIEVLDKAPNVSGSVCLQGGMRRQVNVCFISEAPSSNASQVISFPHSFVRFC